MARESSRVVVVATALLLLAVPAVEAGSVLEFVVAERDGVGGVDGLHGAESVVVSPDGRHVYVASWTDNAVAVFSCDGRTGRLTFVAVVSDGAAGVDGLGGASAVAVSPDGSHVYVGGNADDALAVFHRAPATGVLTFVEVLKDGVGGVDGLNGAEAVAVSTDGKHVYVASEYDHAVAVFARDLGTGRLSFVEAQTDGSGGIDGLQGAVAVAASGDGKHVYAASQHDNAVAVFQRDGASGQLAFVEVQIDGVNGVNGLEYAQSVTVSSDGAHVYVAGSFDDAVAVFARDGSTGKLTFVEARFDGRGGVEGLEGARSVAVSPDGTLVYVASSVDDALAVFARDPASGRLTFSEVHSDGLHGVDGLDGARDVVVSPDSAHVYVAASIDRAVTVFWKDFPVAVVNGNEAYAAGDYSTAEQYYSSLIAADPTWAVAYNNRGLTRCKLLDFSGAEADFAAAKGLDPTYVAPYLNQGKCLAMQSDFAGARAEFEAGLTIDPEHVKLLYNLGWVEAEEGRYDEALASYSAALAEDPAYVRAMVASGVALAEKGETNSAVDAFYEAINTAPGGDLFAAISAYNLQLLRGPGLSFASDTAAQDYQDALFQMRVGLFQQAADRLADAQFLLSSVADIPWLFSWCRLRQQQSVAAGDAYADARALMPVIEVDSSSPSQVFIDGIFRGNTPQTASVLPSRFDVAFRRSQGPKERTVVAYADGTPGGVSPMNVTLLNVSTLSQFAAEIDSDRDWLADAWEQEHFGDLREGPAGDSDGDGISNLLEYWGNTDPGPGSVRWPRVRRRLTGVEP